MMRRLATGHMGAARMRRAKIRAGGFAPFIATWLIGETGSNLAPSYYLISMRSAAGLRL
jgi:hypothetical protein